MRGSVQNRGKNSWRLKFDAGRDAATGKRNIQYITFHGNKREAQLKLAELITAVGKDSYVKPSKTTVGEFVRVRIDQWEAAGDISARTAQRYRQLLKHQVAPHIGTKALQKLQPLDIEQWHTVLRSSGRVRGKGTLSARTLNHAHKLLGKALADAAKNEMVNRNVARLKSPPKVTDTGDEMVIVHDVLALMEKLRGSALNLPALLGLYAACGLARYWRCVGTASILTAT